MYGVIELIYNKLLTDIILKTKPSFSFIILSSFPTGLLKCLLLPIWYLHLNHFLLQDEQKQLQKETLSLLACLISLEYKYILCEFIQKKGQLYILYFEAQM